jgi:hypothetical protein
MIVSSETLEARPSARRVGDEKQEGVQARWSESFVG